MKIFHLSSILFSILILTLTFSSESIKQVEAWWCMGHMLVSQIAMLNVNDHVRAVADKHFKYFSQIGPFPRVEDAVEGACWADDVKTYGLQQMSGWHFINTPYNPENMANIPNMVQDINVATAIPGFAQAIKVVNQNGWTDTFSLAYLIHLYGDIHQPLHCVSYFSPEFPTGDEGGNLIILKWNGQPLNLHAFWDSVCQQPQYNDPVRPLSKSSRNWVQDTAKKLNNTYGAGISLEEVLLSNTSQIAHETYMKAQTVAYNGIVGPGNQTGNGTYPSWYQQKCINTAERQIVLGGLRLAKVLNAAFWNATMPTLLVTDDQKPENDKAGMFFGGFFCAVFLIAGSFVVYRYVWNGKNNNNKAGGYENVDGMNTQNQQSNSAV